MPIAHRLLVSLIFSACASGELDGTPSGPMSNGATIDSTSVGSTTANAGSTNAGSTNTGSTNTLSNSSTNTLSSSSTGSAGPTTTETASVSSSVSSSSDTVGSSSATTGNPTSDGGGGQSSTTSTTSSSSSTSSVPSSDKFVGNITQGNALPSNFANYWNQLTPENEGKWDAVEPVRDQMNWNSLDQYYQFTRNNGYPFKQHAFVWGQQQPQWIGSLSSSEQAAEVEEWMREFCTRYPDVEMIDVVNEPLHETPVYVNAIGGSGSTGWDWVVWAFEKARQHCPNAILILNDYNVLSFDTDAYIPILRLLDDRGLVDAAGLQSHSLEQESANSIRSKLNQVAAVGLPIYISEYDVEIGNDNQQLSVIQEQFPIFYEHSAVVGITLWGYVQGQHWRPNAYLLRENLQERPALTWLMDFLGR